MRPEPALGAPPGYEDMLAALARDLKNPLAVIRAGAQHLDPTLERSAGRDAAELRRGLARIQAESERLMLLLDDLVDAGAVPRSAPPRKAR
jgi:signal transduction histidine kinase